MSVPAQYVYRYQDGKVTKSPSEIRPLASKEILLKITHSSLCGTDLTYAGSGVALGHEGVGIVAEIGSEVTHLKVGDRAGGGYHRHSCGQCSYCLGGQDIWCYDRVVFGEGDTSNGTFATFYVAHETYLHRIPDSLPSEYAAPLQCAGATVYSAVIATVKPTQRVGIVGIGGLGHLAIQFASKMGAEVVVFSSSRNKEGEARGFGASEFYLTNEPEKITKPVDVLVVAGSRSPDWSKYLEKNVLARRGVIVPLAAAPGNLELPAFNMLLHGYNVHSSLVASRAVHDDMLQFAARHQIRPLIQKFEFSEKGLGEAIKHMENGTIRYRGVLVAE